MRLGVRLSSSVGALAALVLLSGCIRFGPPVLYQASPTQTSSVKYAVYADVTGDGVDDAIVGTTDYATTRMAPCGVDCIQPAESLPVFGNLAAADFNGDGTDDLVVSDQVAGIEVFFGSDGSTRPEGLSADDTISLGGSNTNGVVAGDLNSDGFADIGFVGFDPTSFASYRYVIIPGDGAGGFGPLQVVYSAFGVYVTDLQIGDVDGDGHLEAVALTLLQSDDGHTINASYVSAVSSTGESVRSWGDPIASYLTHLAVGDVDGDGRDDVAFSSYKTLSNGDNQTRTIALRSRSTDFGPFGSAGQPLPLDLPGTVRGLALRDLNGDGLSDLTAVTSDSPSTGHLSWWRATSTGLASDGRKDRSLPFGVSDLALGDVGGPGFQPLVGHEAGPYGAFSVLANISNG